MLILKLKSTEHKITLSVANATTKKSEYKFFETEESLIKYLKKNKKIVGKGLECHNADKVSDKEYATYCRSLDKKIKHIELAYFDGEKYIGPYVEMPSPDDIPPPPPPPLEPPPEK